MEIKVILIFCLKWSLVEPQTSRPRSPFTPCGVRRWPRLHHECGYSVM